MDSSFNEYLSNEGGMVRHGPLTVFLHAGTNALSKPTGLALGSRLLGYGALVGVFLVLAL